MTGICPFSQVMKPRQNVTELVGSESTIHLYNCGLHGVFSVLKPAEGGRAGRWGGGAGRSDSCSRGGGAWGREIALGLFVHTSL